MVLGDAALGRPYCDLAVGLMDGDGRNVHAQALTAIWDWQARSLASFARMRADGVTIALVGRSEFCWSHVSDMAAVILPR